MTVPLHVGNGEDGGIFTFTGEYIHPLAPEIDRIHIEDIAYSLATQNRFTGHAYPPYSIGQHSIHVCELVAVEFKFEALLHDAGETFMSDIARPVKRAEGMEQYRSIESRLDQAVCERFNLPWPHSPEIKVADNLMLWAEMRDLMPNDLPDGVEARPEKVIPWTWEKTHERFLSLFSELSLLSEVGVS